MHLIDSTNAVGAECKRYSALLLSAPLDIVCLGIGENGHLAFNDPDTADFDDPLAIKPVELSQASRQQQVNDKCFPSLDAVPTHAITLTVPTLLAGTFKYCIVPGSSKRNAVQKALSGPISTACPALHSAPHATVHTVS